MNRSLQSKSLGKSGLKISEVILGAMTFGDQVDEATSFNILDRAYESGIFTFDTADFYPFPGRSGTQGNSERILGDWAKSRNIRHQVVLATKGPGRTTAGPNGRGGSRKHLMKALEESLVRLGGDYIDLYQFGPDPTTPIEETIGAMNDMVRQGKVLYLGCSASDAWWVTKALWKADVGSLEKPQVIQFRYNLIDREAERELIPLCVDQGLGAITFSPLAGGMLSGKYLGNSELSNTRASFLPRYRNLLTEKTEHVVKEISTMAKDRSITPSQLALAWVMNNQAITAPIIGVSAMRHLDDALGALGIVLSAEELDRCDELYLSLNDFDPKADRRDIRVIS
jgi:aryl-alcohol dehydrogenase (NADP+)